MRGTNGLRTSPESPVSGNRQRRVISWHITDEGRYRVVVTTWFRATHSTTNESKGYTSKTVYGLWLYLWLSGIITTQAFRSRDAYRTFVILGLAAPRHTTHPSTTTPLPPHPSPNPPARS